MNYWTRQEEFKQKAKEHTAEMERLYANEIRAAVAKSQIFTDRNVMPLVLEAADAKQKKHLPALAFAKQTTTDALFTSDKRTCVLNFASYKEPGGKFLEGSSAQEESLCHASYLYNVLAQMPRYYAYNQQHKNRGLWLNRAIYTPQVRFMQGKQTVFADVLTCAAPNRALIRYQRFTEKENQEVLASRIQFLVRILNTLKEPPENLILGNYGGGVFRQDPATVAKDFFQALSYLQPKISVVFAIPDANLKVFQRVYRQHVPPER